MLWSTISLIAVGPSMWCPGVSDCVASNSWLQDIKASTLFTNVSPHCHLSRAVWLPVATSPIAVNDVTSPASAIQCAATWATPRPCPFRIKAFALTTRPQSCHVSNSDSSSRSNLVVFSRQLTFVSINNSNNNNTITVSSLNTSGHNNLDTRDNGQVFVWAESVFLH